MSVATASEPLITEPVVNLADRSARLGVVERVTQILDTFTDAPGRLLLEDITRITGLPRSTAFRILRQLIDQGWVEYDAPGYRLGTRLSMLAACTLDYEDVRAAASVALNELQLATGAVVHLSVLEGGVVHYLDKVGGAAASSVPSRVGARIVASDTVSGRSLLAFLPPERVDAIITAARGGNGQGLDLPALHRELTAIRQHQGIAVSAGERRHSGITSIAAPVLGPRGPIASVSVAGRGTLASASVAPLVLRAARVVARNLNAEWFEAQHTRAGARPWGQGGRRIG